MYTYFKFMNVTSWHAVCVCVCVCVEGWRGGEGEMVKCPCASMRYVRLRL